MFGIVVFIAHTCAPPAAAAAVFPLPPPLRQPIAGHGAPSTGHGTRVPKKASSATSQTVAGLNYACPITKEKTEVINGTGGKPVASRDNVVCRLEYLENEKKAEYSTSIINYLDANGPIQCSAITKYYSMEQQIWYHLVGRLLNVRLRGGPTSPPSRVRRCH